MKNIHPCLDADLLVPGLPLTEGHSQMSENIFFNFFNMAVFFWYFIKSDLSSVRYCTRLHWTSNFFQGTRKTRPCLTGYPKNYSKYHSNKFLMH